MTLTSAQLTEELRALGVMPGALIMVHASLRRLGPVQGRATAVIQAILDAVGSRGTLLMVLGAAEGAPFDANRTPVDIAEMGVLAEAFRTFNGVQVNDHASDRFAAYGPLASELIDDPPLHDYLGTGSPLDRFTDHGGQVLRLGADIDTVTLTHLAEYRADIPNKRRVRRRYERADIGEQWIECLDDCDGIVDWADGDYFSQILIDFIASGDLRTARVGSCCAELFDGASFLEFATRWMETKLA